MSKRFSFSTDKSLQHKNVVNIVILLTFVLIIGSACLVQADVRAYMSAPAGCSMVSAFGAVGDGITDDSAAMQNAFDSVSGGGEIAFEPGKTYLMVGDLGLLDADGVTIYGQGAVIKYCDNHNFTTYWNLRFIRCSHLYVHDLVVDGNRDNNVPEEAYKKHNIHIMQCTDFGFYNVESSNGNCDGFYVLAGNDLDTNTFCKRGDFVDCVATNNYRDGMSIINGWDIRVIGGEYSYSNGTLPKSGIDVEPHYDRAQPGCDNILIRNAMIVGNNGHGVKMDGYSGNRNCTIEYCYFSDNLRSAIYMGSTDNVIRNNVFYDFERFFPGSSGQPTQGTIRINGESVTGCIMTGNLMAKIHYTESENGYPPIYIAYQPTDIEIRDNEFYDFRYYIPMVVSGGDMPADFYDVNIVDPDRVIADPGLPQIGGDGDTSTEPVVKVCRFTSSSIAVPTGIVLMAAAGMRKRRSLFYDMRKYS